jgi:uncharacterized membrane protein
MKYLVAMLIAFGFSLYPVFEKIEQGHKVQSASYQKVTTVVIYEGGCFDIKEGNKTVVRCI